MPCGSKTAWRFGGTYRLHLQGLRISQQETRRSKPSASAGFLVGIPFDPEDGGDKFLPKRWAVPEQHDVASQKNVLFIDIGMRTSDPTGSNGFVSQG
jgi:hypothetical protein